MRRIFTVLTVIVLVEAMLVVMAAPALAEPFNPPPNCENGQDQAFVSAPSDSLQAKHLYNYLDCVLGTPPGEGQVSS